MSGSGRANTNTGSWAGGQLDPRRRKMAADPYRPRYHFLAPANWMNDPNGAIFREGRYHLFYQYNPNGAFHGSIHWGHAASEDLVHWMDLPVALAPTPGGPDEAGCWSGCAVDHDGVPTLVYHGKPGGICIATGDDALLSWRKHPRNPVIPEPPEGQVEWLPSAPCAWREGDTWHLLSGRCVGRPLKTLGASRDAAFMFRARDMAHWEYRGTLYEPGEESDCAVPDFFPLDDRHILLFASHTRGGQYYIGAYGGHRFVPEHHGRLNFTTFDRKKAGMLASGDLIAPISWEGPDGRRVMIAWIAEGRSKDAQAAAGWAGVMSIPRVLSLDGQRMLRMEPLPELQVLRRDHRQLGPIRVEPDSAVTLPDVPGDGLELAVEFEPGSAGVFGVKVRCAPDGAEKTLIYYNRGDGTLTLDPAESSTSPDVVGRSAQRAPLDLTPSEPLKLRIFLDRSVLEVFANRRLCLSKRIYPARSDSLGVQLFADGDSVTARSIDAWAMASIWPERSP